MYAVMTEEHDALVEALEFYDMYALFERRP